MICWSWRTANHRQYGAFDEFPPAFSCCWTPAASEIRRCEPNTTRELAMRLVSQLRAGDQVAALQFGGKVELIQTWTSDQSVAIHSLKTKLSSGRYGRFQNALAAASAQL